MTNVRSIIGHRIDYNRIIKSGCERQEVHTQQKLTQVTPRDEKETAIPYRVDTSNSWLSPYRVPNILVKYVTIPAY